jgi:hypothetical protein
MACIFLLRPLVSIEYMSLALPAACQMVSASLVHGALSCRMLHPEGSGMIWRVRKACALASLYVWLSSLSAALCGKVHEAATLLSVTFAAGHLKVCAVVLRNSAARCV